jgi:predicted amidophosphoribosyltransferase
MVFLAVRVVVGRYSRLAEVEHMDSARPTTRSACMKKIKRDEAICSCCGLPTRCPECGETEIYVATIYGSGKTQREWSCAGCNWRKTLSLRRRVGKNPE